MMDVRGSLANPLNKQPGAPSILVTPNVIPRHRALCLAPSISVRIQRPMLGKCDIMFQARDI